MTTSSTCRVLKAAGDREQRRLARAARSHDGDEQAALYREINVLNGVNLGNARSVRLRRTRRSSRKLIDAPPVVGQAVDLATPTAARTPRALQRRPSAVSSQRTSESSRIQLCVDHECESEVEVGLVFLESRPLLHELNEIATMDLDHVVHRHPRHANRRENLDHELVPRRRGHV